MVKLIRHTTGVYGTFGVLLKDNLPLCDIIERPWLNNQHNISCIPEGTYSVTEYISPTKGNVWMVQDVPNRSNIEIHIANFASELEGCLAPGYGYLWEVDKVGVRESAVAFAELKRALPQKFILSIINQFIGDKI